MFVKYMEQIMYFKLYMYFTLGVEFWQLLFLLPNLLISEFVLLYYPSSFFSCCVLLHLMKISQFIYSNWLDYFTKISDTEVNVLVYVSLRTHMTKVFLAYMSVDSGVRGYVPNCSAKHSYRFILLPAMCENIHFPRSLSDLIMCKLLDINHYLIVLIFITLIIYKIEHTFYRTIRTSFSLSNLFLLYSFFKDFYLQHS